MDPRRLARSVLALALLVFACHASLLSGWLIDDAGITLAYARNLAVGHGLVSQPGAQPLEGFSNPLWTLLLAGTFRLTGVREWIPLAWSTLFSVLTIWSLHRILKSIGLSMVFMSAALLGGTLVAPLVGRSDLAIVASNFMRSEKTDARHLIFSMSRNSSVMNDGNPWLGIVDSNTVSQLLPTLKKVYWAALSPDGTRLAVNAGAGVVLVFTLAPAPVGPAKLPQP